MLLAVVLVAGLALLASLLLALATQHGKELETPDFTNMSVAEARKVAAAAGLRVLVSDSVYVRRLRPGAVYMQSPRAGAMVKKGRRIRLTTNTTKAKEVQMPSLLGCSLRQAKAELLRNGLLLGRISYVRDIATNAVLKQRRAGFDIEAGASVVSGTTIDLVLGLNPNDDKTFVPNLISQKYTRAIDMIQENSLNVAQLRFDSSVKTYADSLAALVYEQKPQSDSVAVVKGSGVSIFLSIDEKKLSKLQ